MNRSTGIFISVFLFILPMRLFSQPLNFEKFFIDTDILYSVQQTTDNGYILSGLVNEGEESSANLIKVNNKGETLWKKQYPSISKRNHYKTMAIETSDGGYIIAGSVENYDDSDIFLVKTDDLGNTIWGKTYGDSVEYKLWSVQKTKNNGYLISAFRNINHAHLIKTNSVGEIEWEWDFGPILSFDLNYQAIQTSDQGFAVVIKNNLFKLDGNGDSLWAKTQNNNYYLIQESDNKSLILAGSNILMKADSSGNEMWLKENLSLNPNVLRVTSDGGSVLGEGQLLKVDEGGTEEWRIDLDGMIYGLVQSGDDGYTFCGGDLVSPFLDRGWLVKTDQKGYYKSLILYKPEDGERIQFNENYTIKWRSVNVNHIEINFSENKGMIWEIISTSVEAEDGEYLWQVPFSISEECVIRLIDSEQPELSSQNEHPFFIISRQYDYISVNQIKMWFSNDGNGSHHPLTNGQGLLWPGGVAAKQGAVFEDGLVFAGIINGDYYAGGNTYRAGLQAGNILADGSAANSDSSVFGVWKIRRDWGVFPPGP